MAEFLIGYSILRWIGELFREPDAALILGMSRGSFYSLLLLAVGIGILVWIRRRRLTNGQSL
jgi:phosphatidylglycerol:prolipoprotein diacylglycerol transferase